MAEFYGCGCCGCRISSTALWCVRCAGHVAKDGHLWDRTFEAVHGEPCPYKRGRLKREGVSRG